MSKYHDIRTLLGQLPGSRKSLDAKLRGVNVDKLVDDGHRLLPDAAWDGNALAVKYLLEKGASPAAVSTWGAVHGPALYWAITANVATKAKLEIVKALIAAGADTNAKLVLDKQARAFENGFKGGVVLDFAVADAAYYQKEAKKKSYDADSARYMKKMAEQYAATLPLLVAAGATGSPATMKALAKLGVAQPAKQKPLDARWPAKARAKLKGGGRDEAYDVCEQYLAHPAAIASAEWPKLVEEVIALSRTFVEVAEEVYGERVTFADDEGWLCQGWDQYVVLDVVLELLGKEATHANAQWERLVRRVLELRRKYDATSIDVDDFFTRIRKHAAYKQLVAFEKKTR